LLLETGIATSGGGKKETMMQGEKSWFTKYGCHTPTQLLWGNLVRKYGKRAQKHKTTLSRSQISNIVPCFGRERENKEK
jgi:hypothetical protein